MAIQYENLTDDGLLFKFKQLVEEGRLREVSKQKYDEFVTTYLMEGNIPVANDANIYHMGKRVGALYNELYETEDEGQSAYYSCLLGNESLYEYVNQDSEADFGWVDDIGSGGTYYYMNPDCYPSWFNENIVHFSRRKKK